MVHNSYRQHTLFVVFLNCLLCDLLKHSLSLLILLTLSWNVRKIQPFSARIVLLKDCHNTIYCIVQPSFLGTGCKMYDDVSK